MSVRLDDISFDDPISLDPLLRQWREAIERANSWDIGGNVEFNGGPSGYTLFIRPPRGVMSAVVTTEITAAPDADTLGEGVAMLRLRSGADLTDQEEVTVFSDFSVPVPVGTRIKVAPDGEAYALIAADFCPTAP
jgi:hypothetical protein